MVDGGVSIAVRPVYPGKQSRIMPSEVLQQVKIKGRQSRASSTKFQSFIDHEEQSDHRDGNDSNCWRPRPQGRS